MCEGADQRDISTVGGVGVYLSYIILLYAVVGDESGRIWLRRLAHGAIWSADAREIVA